VSLDVIEFNGLSLADSSFDGIDNIACKSRCLVIQCMSLADSSFGAIDHIVCGSDCLRIQWIVPC
jgi:hypothetical protein